MFWYDTSLIPLDEAGVRKRVRKAANPAILIGKRACTTCVRLLAEFGATCSKSLSSLCEHLQADAAAPDCVLISSS